MEVRNRGLFQFLAMLVFDASKPDTMDALDNWLRDLQQNNVGRQCIM